MLAFLLENLDTGLRSVAEVESVIELPSLAIIPRFRRPGEIPGQSVTARNLISLAQPKSQFAEAFRSLRTALMLSSAGHPPKFILLTSATPSEGKTTASTNLATILAQGDARVLLIDADLRRPTVHQRFGLNAKTGLSTLLTGAITLEQAVQTIPEIPNLDVLVSGPIPPLPDRDAELRDDEEIPRSSRRALYPCCDRLSSGAVGHRCSHSGSRGRCGRSRHSPRQVEQACRSPGPGSSPSLRSSGYRHSAKCRGCQFAGLLRLLRLFRLLECRIRCRHMEVQDGNTKHRRLRGGKTMIQRSGLRAITRAAIISCVFLGMFTSAAQAQFNGPSLSTAGAINEPVALTTDRSILFPAAHDLRIFHGDLIAVHLYPTTDYAPTVRVSLDGSIQLPLIGKVQVEGLTIPQAEKLIAGKLVAAGMYKNPQITLQLTESPNQVATVTGELHTAVPVFGQNRLLDVLTAAGGLPHKPAAP